MSTVPGTRFDGSPLERYAKMFTFRLRLSRHLTLIVGSPGPFRPVAIPRPPKPPSIPDPGIHSRTFLGRGRHLLPCLGN